MQLVNSVIHYGQRALVGKVSMNVENDMNYYNPTDKEISDTEKFLDNLKLLQVGKYLLFFLIIFI